MIVELLRNAGALPLDYYKELVMKSVNARRVYGLSATPKRPDGLERAIYILNSH